MTLTGHWLTKPMPHLLERLCHTFQLSLDLELVFAKRYLNAIWTYVSVTICCLVGVALIIDALRVAVGQTVPNVLAFAIGIPSAFNLDRTSSNSKNKVFRKLIAVTWSGNSKKVKFCVSHKRYFARFSLRKEIPGSHLFIAAFCCEPNRFSVFSMRAKSERW